MVGGKVGASVITCLKIWGLSREGIIWGELVKIMCRPPFVHQVMWLPWASPGINQQPRGSCNLRGIAPGLYLTRTSLVAQRVKASAYNAGNPGSIPGWEDPLQKEMATHSSTLAWKIPWTEKPGRLQSMGSQRVGHD